MWRYGYGVGLRSARGLEPGIPEDLGLRYLAAGAEPDNWALSEFRRRHGRGATTGSRPVRRWQKACAAADSEEGGGMAVALAHAQEKLAAMPGRYTAQVGGGQAVASGGRGGFSAGAGRVCVGLHRGGSGQRRALHRGPRA